MPDKIINMTNGKRILAGRGMGMSLPWAEFISYWGNWVLVAALLIGVAATFGIVVSGNVKEIAMKRELAASAERTGLLEKDAELIRQDNNRLEAQLSPRKLRPDQMQAIANALVGFSGRSIRVRSYALDVESAFLATQLMAAFTTAGLTVDNNILSDSPMGVLGLGIFVTGTNQGLVDAVLKTLANDGLLATRPQAVPAGAGMSQANNTPTDALVFVGVRPPKP